MFRIDDVPSGVGCTSNSLNIALGTNQKTLFSLVMWMSHLIGELRELYSSPDAKNSIIWLSNWFQNFRWKLSSCFFGWSFGCRCSNDTMWVPKQTQAHQAHPDCSPSLERMTRQYRTSINRYVVDVFVQNSRTCVGFRADERHHTDY